MRCVREPEKRKSNDLFRDNANYKRQRSMSKESSPMSDDSLNAEVVISNLEDVMTQAKERKDELPEAAKIELKGFEPTTPPRVTVEAYMQKRDEIRQMVGDSDFFDRKTELNLGVASVAGAQLEIDKRITTRRMSRKLHNECGIKEQDILYKGLDYHGPESRASKELRDSRQASIIESCVDLQKQMQWKYKIMDHVKAKADPAAGKTYPMSDGPSIRTRGGQDKQREDMKKQKKEIEKNRRAGRDGDPFKTPQKQVEFNALDERRIIENYQLEVASEVRTHRPQVLRGIAPIPYNINILDEDEEMEF